MIYYLLSTLWFLRQIKATLFWLYLWQLKEYHIGRFIDHFRTEMGKKLIFHPLQLLKLVLIPFLFYFFFPGFVILISIYIIESIFFFKSLFQGGGKKPVLTKKTFFLIVITLIFQILFVSIHCQKNLRFLILLLILDILTPVIISGILLLFQPLTVFWRRQVIEKAKQKRIKHKDLLVIGITGSYGKTSTKEFLTTILEAKFNVLKTKAHQNSEVGISQCILEELEPSHEVFVVEMGAYNKGGIKLLSDIVKPKIGILTGINEQHMVLFGSQENIIRTKFELIESLPAEGVAIFNGNSGHIMTLKPQIDRLNLKSKIFCSTRARADIWAENIKAERETLSFKVISKEGETANFKLNLFGAHNVENILLAVACAKELGLNLEKIARACEKIKPSQSGMELKKTASELNLIDATYSANFNSVISHLNYLKVWKGKKIIIMPCLIELGAASREVHRRMGEGAAKVCDLAIITTEEHFEDIKKGAMAGGMREEDILFLQDPNLIFEVIKPFCQPENVILLEGRVPKELVYSLIHKKIRQFFIKKVPRL